jgi:hypothetical protein
VTAVITYKTPFRLSGQAVLLSYGLSESASTNTIIGIPFLRATRSAMIMTGDDEEVIICQRLGTTFRVEYQVPLRANQAPKVAQDTHSAFSYHVETPTAITEELERLLSSMSLSPPPASLYTKDGHRSISYRRLNENQCVRPRIVDETSPGENDNSWTINFDLPNIE